MASMSAWTDEELRLLDKACKKFPMGTPKRCELGEAWRISKRLLVWMPQ
jgi:hypothetical protein